ncbi:MAG: ANTAR domain-containing protein [Gammaproteobacteria bacterium]|nr:ANTAR domain-containing protein [Gammaproteobacteria bacterium]
MRDVTMKLKLNSEQRKIALVNESSERAQVLEQALTEAGFLVAAKLFRIRDLIEQMGALRIDAIIIDMEQPDHDLLDDLRIISRDHPRPILVFAQRSDEHMIRQAMRVGVSSFVVDGWSSTRVKSLVEIAIARFEENQALRTELDQAKTTLAERKVIERAKGILMQRRKCDEHQAYGLLRKIAMDRNEKLVEVAHQVIGAAELLG